MVAISVLLYLAIILIHRCAPDEIDWRMTKTGADMLFAFSHDIKEIEKHPCSKKHTFGEMSYIIALSCTIFNVRWHHANLKKTVISLRPSLSDCSGMILANIIGRI